LGRQAGGGRCNYYEHFDKFYDFFESFKSLVKFRTSFLTKSKNSWFRPACQLASLGRRSEGAVVNSSHSRLRRPYKYISIPMLAAFVALVVGFLVADARHHGKASPMAGGEGSELAGMIDVSGSRPGRTEGSALFYWFTPAQTAEAPEKQPLLIWLQGM
jgi:hypothetical protein